MKRTMDKDNKRISDMTTGRPLKLIGTFTVPIFAGNLLQQMYTIVDAAVVGHGVGLEGLAAVGATDWMYWLFLWTAVGFGQGFAIFIAISFGEKNYENLQRSVSAAICLSLGTGIGMSIVGSFIAEPLLKLLDTPGNIMDMSASYIGVLYAGIPVVMMYNMAACILRALGDSKSPFLALIISSLLNIVLDLLFVMVFGWGVAGAAIATVISQLVSTGYSFWRISRTSLVQLSRQALRPEKEWLRLSWSKGWPMAIQMSFIAVGGIIVQFVVNGMGFLYVAGFAAGSKLIGLIESLPMSLGNALATYVGQNYGSRNFERIKAGIRDALLVSICAYALLGCVLWLMGDRFLLLFIAEDSQQFDEVMHIAYTFLKVVLVGMIFLYVIHVYRQSFVGVGDMKITLLSGIVESVTRVIMAVVIAGYVIGGAIYFVEPITWCITGLYTGACWYSKVKKIGDQP